jgi:hypothetical protein
MMNGLPIRGRLSGVLLAVIFGAVFVTGMLTGGNAAAAGEQPIDFYATATGDTFTDGGELAGATTGAETDAPYGMDRYIVERSDFDLIETPRLDEALRENLTIPLLKVSFRLADAGYSTGYWMASAIGPWSVKGVSYLWQLAMLGGVAWSVKRRIPT